MSAPMGAHHPHIPPADAAPPTTARRACPSTTRPTTATPTPSDTHSNGTPAGEAIGRVTAVGGGSSPPAEGCSVAGWGLTWADGQRLGIRPTISTSPVGGLPGTVEAIVSVPWTTVL